MKCVREVSPMPEGRRDVPTAEQAALLVLLGLGRRGSEMAICADDYVVAQCLVRGWAEIRHGPVRLVRTNSGMVALARFGSHRQKKQEDAK